MWTEERAQGLETSSRESLPFSLHDKFACLKATEGVGIRPRRLGGDLSNLAFLLEKLHDCAVDVSAEALAPVLRQLEILEHNGWTFDCAEASFLLKTLKLLKSYRPWFELERYCVVARGRNQSDGVSLLDEPGPAEASVKLKINGEVRHTVKEGNGPIHALELALREALRPACPRLDEVALTDCAVRVLDGIEGTGARVRVIVQSWDRNSNRGWGSLGVSGDIVMAGWLALVDALEFKWWLDANDC